MSSTGQPWFFFEALSARFLQDIQDALNGARITAQQALWLNSLVSQHSATPPARVDRLLREDNKLISAELAGALLISDSSNASSEVYLSTVLNGLERFDSRQLLLTSWSARFGGERTDLKNIEFKKVENELFEQQMLAIIDQQALHLQRVSEHLRDLPSLRNAIGWTLQQQINAQLPDTTLNVFTHLALIKEADTPTHAGATLGPQKMVDCAMQAFAGKPLAAGLHQQLLADDGGELSEDQARPYLQALAGVKGALIGVYEDLLGEYWRSSTGRGAYREELACQAYADRFRQQLLVARHEVALTTDEYVALKTLCSAVDSVSDKVKVFRLAIQRGSREAFKLAGVLLIEFTAEHLQDVLLYSPKRGFERFPSLGALTEHFVGNAGRAQILEHSSINDHRLLSGQGLLHVRMDAVLAKPFTNVVDSVIALQKRDLASILRGAFTSAAHAEVMVDDVLDIRALIDPRLVTPDQSSGWKPAMDTSEKLWSGFSSPARLVEPQMAESSTDQKAAVESLKACLSDARSRVDDLFMARPTVRGCAKKLLNHYFSVLFGEPLDEHLLWFREGDATVVSMSSLLMAHITGRRAVKPALDGLVYMDPVGSAYSQHLSWLTPELLTHVMMRLQEGFAREYRYQIRTALEAAPLRIFDSLVIPADASRLIRERLLRLELNMHRQASEVSNHGLDMLEQVLDRPIFNLRDVFAYQATEAYVPFLVYDNLQAAVPLSNVLILQQPLNGDGIPVQWSAVMGLREFENMDELQIDLKARFAFIGSRDRWLNQIAESEREKIRDFLHSGGTLGINMVRVDGHCFEYLDNDESQRRCQALDYAYLAALDWQVDGALFENMAASTALDDNAHTLIDKLSSELQLGVLLTTLPDWLKNASALDQLKYREMLVHFRQLYSSRQPLAIVYSLTEYTAVLLRQRLDKDFPTELIDPNQVLITLTRYTAAIVGTGDLPSSVPGATTVISESLTQYAINRLSNFQDALLRVSPGDSSPLPVSLDATYVSELVRTLDVATGYERYLDKRFSEQAPGYAALFNQFVSQVPWGLRLMAFTLKLQGGLSSTAYEFVESIVSMPDGVARMSVNGRAVIVSPLQLIAGANYSPDLVTGVYLIGPQDSTAGPWILHAITDADFIFKEYASQSALLYDLQASTKLQALVLERMAPGVRFLYEQGGFMRPHLSWPAGGYMGLSEANPGPAELSIEPVKENILRCLFRSVQKVLLITARKKSVTNEQADTLASRFLLELAAGQVLSFLPGRLGGLVGVWQSKELLGASLSAVADHQLGKASAELVAALGVLISARQQTEENLLDGVGAESNSEDDAATRWHDSQLQLDPGNGLQFFEDHGVSLSELHRDQTQHIYTDTVTLKHYAAMFGKVYQIKQGDNGWCVTDGANDGPRIRLDNQQRWELDPALGIRQQGGALTRLRSALTDMDVEDVFLIEARGVVELKRLFPARAIQVVEAHGKACGYLHNALENLTVPQGQQLDPRVARILMDFFGVRSMSTISLDPLKQTFTDIYQWMLDPAYSPHSSSRYVAGMNKLGSLDTNAFTFIDDPLKRIFLTEQFFFRPPSVRLKSTSLRSGGFNIGMHYRAVILIHEFSHIANGTHDIAYVDSKMPFLDLIDDTGGYRARMKLEYEQAQKNLSHATLRDRLFQIEGANGWQDLKTADGEAKRAVLKIAGASSLEDARERFLNDPKIRCRIILSNADSVALLATLLGRERF